MRSSTFSITLAVSLGCAALMAACGGGAPSPEVPTAPSASAPTPPSTPGTTAATAPPPPATTAPPADTTPPPTTPPPAAAKAMPDVGASAMADKLKGIGLDIAKLPKMGALTGAQRGKVMPIIAEATGMKCGDCHVQGNFKAETPMKQVGRKMWDEFVAPDKLSAGPLFCDSCHKGQPTFLARSDKQAVGAYMDAQYTKKITTKGANVACTTCHGSDMEMKIFEKVWKIKDAPKPSAEIDAPKPVFADAH